MTRRVDSIHLNHRYTQVVHIIADDVIINVVNLSFLCVMLPGCG
jgi:hypothetical protein